MLVLYLLLIYLLEKSFIKRIRMSYNSLIVFQTRRKASWLSEKMAADGHAVAVLTGDLTVEQRIAVLDRFRASQEKVLITTNVLSRGINKYVAVTRIFFLSKIFVQVSTSSRLLSSLILISPSILMEKLTVKRTCIELEELVVLENLELRLI